MKKLLFIIGTLFCFSSFTFASYTPTENESKTLEAITLKLEKIIKSDPTKADGFKNQLTSLKEKHSTNERAAYILNYLSNTCDIFSRIKRSYLWAKPFADGYALIREQTGSIYYINKNFEKVAGPYSSGMPFSEGYTIVKKSDGKRYVLDKNLSETIIENQGIPSLLYFINSEGFFLFTESDNNNYYYVNTSGKKIGEIYSEGNAFSQGYAVVLKGEDLRWYFIDTTGKEVDGPYVDKPSSFSDGYAVVPKEDGRYYVDKDFKKVSGPYTNKPDVFSEGYAYTKESTNITGNNYIDNSGYIDKTFKKVTGQYNIAKKFSEGYVVIGEVRPGGGWLLGDDYNYYYLNKNFEKIAGPYLSARSFSEGYAVVRKQEDKKHYLIDTTGKEVDGPYINQPTDVSEGYTVVQTQDGSYNFISEPSTANQK